MKIGVLGGGQLGRMLALAGYPLGLHFLFFEPEKNTCASELGAVIHAAWDDEVALRKFASEVDTIIYENENIPLQTIEILNQSPTRFLNQQALITGQHRAREKKLFTQLNIPTTQYIAIFNFSDLKKAERCLSFPFLLKKMQGGYDGKGQKKIGSSADSDLLEAYDFSDGYIAEEWINFQREFSIIGVRNASQDMLFYDLCENIHRNGILIETRNRKNDPFFSIAREYMSHILNALNYIGTMAVEFFQVGDQCLANEMSPRVHNTGHWTIEGACTSQFENHLRAIVDWPLGHTESIGQSVMRNLLGEIPDKIGLLSEKNLFLHDYGKTPREGRKVGHVTKMTDFL